MKLATRVLVFVLAVSGPGTGVCSAARPTLIHGAAVRPEDPAERWYIAIPGGDEDRILDIFRALRDRGATRMQCFLPDVIVCDVPADVDPASVAAGPGVMLARATDALTLSAHRLSISPALIERTRRDRDSNRRTDRDEPHWSGAGDVISESRVLAPEAIRASVLSAGTADDRLIFQNSEILAGTILMQLVLPESDYPDTWPIYETWTAEDMLDIELALYYMALGLQDQFPNASINFVYRWYRQVLVKTEPIFQRVENDKFWLALTMAALGYSGDDRVVPATVHQFNEDARKRSGADWVFTAFIACAERKRDHRFTDARPLSWGYVGGPYFVTSYPAGHLVGYWNFEVVLKHEIGHMFWGVEEDIGPQTDCETRSGYLDVLNSNKVLEYSPIDFSAKGCPEGQNPVPCLMNELYAYEFWVDTPCNVTEHMWGISDKNENGVPDALDRAPVIEFETADVETVLTPPPALDVRVRSQAVPNLNPMQPAPLRRDYAARIRDISVRVGGLSPYTLTPSQIGSDGYEAVFEVPMPPLLPGTLEILVDARNEYNAVSETRVKRYLYVHLKYVTFNIRHPNEGILVSWEMLGATFDANFELVRTCIDTGEEAVVASGFGPSGPQVNGVTPYRVVDTHCSIGAHYTYRVRGTIDLPHRGGTLHKVVESIAIPAQGAVPRDRTPESPVSNTAPNPFTDKTWISVSVPHIDIPAPGTAQSSTNTTQVEEPSTLVQIDVYDVLGRRVSRLYRRWVIGSAVTVSWDGTDTAGTRLPSGVYFVRARVGATTEIRKVLLIR